MRLENHFYKTKETLLTEIGFTCTVELLPNHPIYSGHFPSYPIVPGVCTLTIIKEQISIFLQQKIVYKKIKECKFVSSLTPKEGLLITLNVEITDMQKVNCIVSHDKQIILKLKAKI